MTSTSRKLTTLSLVLGVLAAVYIIGLLVNRPQAEPVVIPSFKAGSVTKIEAGKISLRNSGAGNWQLQIDGSWYPADSSKVSSMLSTLSGLRASRIATSRQSEWASFSVNAASASKLVLLNGSGPLDTLYVGETGSDGGTYVRTGRGAAVYEVFTNLSDYVASNAPYWSYLKILPKSLAVDSLQTISISAHGFSVGGTSVDQSYLLSSSVVNGKSAWVAGGGRSLDQKKVLSLEGELLQLSGDSFAGAVTPEEAGITHPLAVIEVSDQQGGSWKVIVGKRYGAQFYAKRADEPYIYLVNQWSLHRSLPKLSDLEAGAKATGP